MIGQSQVTEPLMTALRTNRVNHAYLFSGPRGCGKTTSARILARCLNCVEGPTDTPCGKCPSCIELGRDGSGSLDVVEIDAASHGGVDDARDLRERAIFAPARDRYKIFILDEAHMVTASGFNALLKIVEEPPEHVKFIFATTEPDKVIGTIRSRTHHYPFRLVPPAQMLDYVQQMCDSEHMTVAPGVLPLVVRAGGGSPRDTLSLLDQLMAGSEGDTIEYERAVALLGYTHSALLDEAIDAIAAADAPGAFAATDRVIQTGQDPRRFVEDLLERLRDLIIVAATSAEGAAAVLRGIPQDELEHMAAQAGKFGQAELSRSADIVNAALTEMTGATSPRLHLELMIARMLVPASDATERGALARVERLERRIGVADAPPASAPASASEDATPAGREGIADTPAGRGASASERLETPVTTPVGRGASASERLETPVTTPAGRGASASERLETSVTTPAGRGASASERLETSVITPAGRGASASERLETPREEPTPAPTAPPAAPPTTPIGQVTTQQVKDAWPQILDAVQHAKRSAWMVVFTASVHRLDDDVLTLYFPSGNDVASFKQQTGGGQGVSEYLRQAILAVLGIRVKFIAKVNGDHASVTASQGSSQPSNSESSNSESSNSESSNVQPSIPQPSSPPAQADSPSRPAAQIRPTAQPPAQPHRQAAGRPDTPSAVGASTTSWPTVAIPGGGGASATADAPSDDDAPPETEPPFEPPVPDEDVASVPAATPSVAAPSVAAPGGWYDGPVEPDERLGRDPGRSAETVGASTGSASRSGSTVGASTSSAAGDSSATRSEPTRPSASVAFEKPQRYGEAVVREILGATFIEEQPAPSGEAR